jgi:hypothetical protein
MAVKVYNIEQLRSRCQSPDMEQYFFQLASQKFKNISNHTRPKHRDSNIHEHI